MTSSRERFPEPARSIAHLRHRVAAHPPGDPFRRPADQLTVASLVSGMIKWPLSAQEAPPGDHLSLLNRTVAQIISRHYFKLQHAQGEAVTKT